MKYDPKEKNITKDKQAHRMSSLKGQDLEFNESIAMMNVTHTCVHLFISVLHFQI